LWSNLSSLQGLNNTQKFNAEVLDSPLTPSANPKGSNGIDAQTSSDWKGGPDLDAFIEKIRWDIVNQKNGWYSGGKMWLPEFTGILRNIKVPRWKDAPDEDRKLD
jgi:hypothetical protein